MVVLGRAGRSPARRAALGSIAIAVGTTSTRTVVLLEHGRCLGGPVLVLFDGTETGYRALATSARVVAETGGDLTVLTPRDDPKMGEELEREVEDWRRESNRKVRILPCRLAEGASGLFTAFHEAGGGTLVLPVDHPVVRTTGLVALMDAVKSPLILVR
jgi:hypothetical protein